jgi:hypothetical protein
MLPTDALEMAIVTEFSKNASSRLCSPHIKALALQLFLTRHAEGQIDAVTLLLARMAIKSHPEAGNVDQIIGAYIEVLQQHVADCMPSLAAWVAQCESLCLPLPIIFSCEKYLAQARGLARDLTPHYFGVAPMIIIGGPSLELDVSDGQVLQIPVSDVYEALPFKVFETYLLMGAIGARSGLLKIDDDTHVERHAPLDLENVRSAFATVDYMGLALASPHHDRAWHQGKCSTAVAPFYGKPFVAPWARGAVYFLSKRAISKLTDHYLRFPGCLAGELYEDKAVGDVLHALGIDVVDVPLERVLQIRTDAPERGVAAAA